MLHHAPLVRTYFLEECISSIIRVTRIGKLGTMLAVASNLSTQRGIVASYCLPILVTPMIGVIRSSETLVLQEPHGMTSQKTAFYMYFGGEKD
jgi:hypothetical protein